MTEPQTGPDRLSPREQEALAAWTRDVARDRQLQADATASAAKRRRTTLLAGSAAGLVLLAGTAYGISQAGTDDTTPTAQPTAAPANPVAATQPTTSAPTTPALTPQQRAEAEAEARYREFVQVDSSIAQAGYRDFKPYDTVAVDPERKYLRVQAVRGRAAGERVIGDIKVVRVSVVSTELERGPGNYPRIVLRVCEDVRGVNVVDRSGKSTVKADRNDFYLSIVTMQQYQPGTKGAEAGGWYVYEMKTPGDTC